MFCTNCGSKNQDDAGFCYNCGKKLVEEHVTKIQPTSMSNSQQQVNDNNQQQSQKEFNNEEKVEQNNYQENNASNDSDSTLRLVAFILNLITTICLGIFLITLAWMIPMTVHTYGIYKGKKVNTIAFGVCTIIFLNFVSGILLLCSTKDN